MRLIGLAFGEQQFSGRKTAQNLRLARLLPGISAASSYQPFVVT
jgi:hypothetical protein